MPNLSNYTKEFKYNLKIAYPVILGMLGHTFVGFVDNVMVGKVGITELGAAALGNTIRYRQSLQRCAPTFLK